MDGKVVYGVDRKRYFGEFEVAATITSGWWEGGDES
jgi:hypothetical protein